MHIKHVVCVCGGLHNRKYSITGPEAVIYYMPCYSCISIALHLTFVSAEMRIASYMMKNKECVAKSCFRFHGGSSFVYFKGYNHNSSFLSACLILDTFKSPRQMTYHLLL